MRYIQINSTFIGLSGVTFSVEAIHDNVSELRICSTSTGNCVLAFMVVGSKDGICNQIAAFLKDKKKTLLELDEHMLG
jgi:hypothetical protein